MSRLPHRLPVLHGHHPAPHGTAPRLRVRHRRLLLCALVLAVAAPAQQASAQQGAPPRGLPQPGSPQSSSPQPSAPQPSAPQPGAPRPGMPQLSGLPAGISREQMWPAPTAEDWAKPCLITWQRSYEDALAVSRETGRPILVCVNMDGEIASEHYAGVRYRQPEVAALYEPYVCVIASVYRHSPRDHDDAGRRILCPRFGSVTCGEHIAIEPGLFEQLFEGERVAPRHIGVELDGAEVYDVYYAWDTETIFDALREGVRDRDVELGSYGRPDAPLVERVGSRHVRDRVAVERSFVEGGPELRRALVEAALAQGADAPLELLRLAISGADAELASLARRALAGASSPGALDLALEALRAPMPPAEREALVAALERLAADSPRARAFATVHRGLAAGSQLIDVEAWTRALAAPEPAAVAAAPESASTTAPDTAAAAAPDGADEAAPNGADADAPGRASANASDGANADASDGADVDALAVRLERQDQVLASGDAAALRALAEDFVSFARAQFEADPEYAKLLFLDGRNAALRAESLADAGAALRADSPADTDSGHRADSPADADAGLRAESPADADARRAAPDPAHDRDLDALIATAAWYGGLRDEAVARAEAAATGEPPPQARSWKAMAALAIFAQSRRERIREALAARRRWPAEWLADLHAASVVLARHPHGTEEQVATHHDDLVGFGAPAQAARLLEEALRRFPASEPLHARLRQDALRQAGASGVEAAYAERLARLGLEPAPRFAGHAAFAAAEAHRRAGAHNEAVAAYRRALAALEPDAHWIALAHAGLARLAFERGDDEAALAELLASFERAPSAAATLDGLNVSPADTARLLLSRLVAHGRDEHVARLAAALQSLDRELLRPPEYDRAGGEPSPDARRFGSRRGR